MTVWTQRLSKLSLFDWPYVTSFPRSVL